jgi:hypothetical protein
MKPKHSALAICHAYPDTLTTFADAFEAIDTARTYLNLSEALSRASADAGRKAADLGRPGAV